MKAPESDRVSDPPVPDTTETLIAGAVQSILTAPLASTGRPGRVRHRCLDDEYREVVAPLREGGGQPIVTVGLRFQVFGISRKPIRPDTGQTKLQTMQLRHASSSSFGRRVAESHDRALPPASRQTM